MIELRGFQPELERNIYKAWDAGHKNVMPVAATGSGKTVVISKLLLDEPGASIAIAHRQELVGQISVALARNGVRHRLVGSKKNSPLLRMISALHIYDTGYSYLDPNAKTGVGGVDTIIRMNHNDPYFKQVRKFVIDEAHHVLAGNKWGTVSEFFPQALGLLPTATPERADGQGLGRHADGIVDEMVLAPGMRDIINAGWLTDYRIICPPNDLDLSHVNISSTGDFNNNQIRKAVHSSSKIVGNVVGHYLKFAKGKLGVTFAVDVEAATEIAAAFRANGVPAEVVSAKTPDQVRAQILRDFAARKILQLVNVDLFGEGFDLPAIEVVSFARPTESFALYCQQFGRVLRLMLSKEVMAVHKFLDDEGRKRAIAQSIKPKGLIIDHVGNVQRHGLPDAYREWTLDRRDRKSRTKSDEIPLTTCVNPNGECYEPYPRTYRCCPNCGYYPEPVGRGKPEYVDGDLTELDEETLRQMRGEISRINSSPLMPKGVDPIVAMAIRKRHWERQSSQAKLKNAIAWWAGLQAAQNCSESEGFRKFYFKFGVDVGTAQTLSSREALELVDKINVELLKNGIDGTVNAELYLIQLGG